MKVCFILLLCVFCNIVLEAQNVVLSGKISDAETGEYLPAATVFIVSKNGGTSANAYGFYSVNLTKGENTLEYSFVGYKKQRITLLILADTLIDIELKPCIALDEVTVVAENNQNRLRSTTVSSHRLSAHLLDEMPSLLGITDIIKELRALPGVNSAAEGSAGLIVRGSGPDENLVLFDGVPIYNINHLSGFFSVFNTDALASADIYKGAYPAKFGGRISSVIDVKMREGNLKKYEGKITIGTIASNLTFEGPLIKDKASFIVSARRTYLDLMLRGIYKVFDDPDILTYNFDDYNAKVNYILNKKNRIYLSGYLGKDKYNNISGSSFQQKMNWGNAFLSARWNSQLSSKTFANITAYVYKYHYDASFIKDYEGSGSTGGDFYTTQYLLNEKNLMNIVDYSLKADFNYSLSNRNHIEYGGQYMYHKMNPNTYSQYKIELKNYEELNLTDTLVYVDINKAFETIFSHEWHAYIADEINISSQITANLGLHYSGFANNSDVHHYVMPRASVVYMPNEQWAVKLASGLYSQYTFMVSNPIIGLPSDLWMQSTQGMQPMLGWQSVLGLMYNTTSNWLFSMESYYKKTQNATDFKEMVTTDYFDSWSEVLSQGEATAYGFECMIEKRNPKYSAKLSYAHNRTQRKFSDLNQGNTYLYTYDSPHNVNIEGNIKFNKKVDLGVSWTYASGKLVTAVEQSFANYYYYQDDGAYWEYLRMGYFNIGNDENMATVSQRNNHRLPAYHRLDVGVNFKKVKKRGTRVWSFGVYNAYYRKNVYYLYQNSNGYKMYSITPIVPYFSYSFKF